MNGVRSRLLKYTMLNCELTRAQAYGVHRAAQVDAQAAMKMQLVNRRA